ncbi:16S rRNA (cytidine(1402)-2'-O)-methyltransferase [Limisalsivibrio acetivorans]|uniref:16S rRNA (cytidine(1402)-2'-O)-methyltransferase n=1 Tax=Limisalsivibrio acetivorans TaxID=1304888 RepID=UPI0003B409B9|nr:16S rRNA (cytidine(1402)-2'-O)-methyltransferase [Limisalsivibrio acetivorans]
MSSSRRVSFIPTPVGNLGDITYRAVEALKNADILFAEDTRTASNLLNHLGIKLKVESLHKDNENKAAERLIELYEEGRRITVASEAGTPCISDPGGFLTSRLVEEGIPFEALPGATAFIPALLLSGFDTGNFYFHGFLPHKKGARDKEIEGLKDYKTTIAFYESPHRVKETLKALLKNFPFPIAVCREITKLYEETVFISSEDDIEGLTIKGEFVIVVNNRAEDEEMVTDAEDMCSRFLKEGLSSKDTLRAMKALGYKRNEAYSAIQKVVEDTAEEE